MINKSAMLKITKPAKKIQKQQGRSFFVAGDLAHVPNSPKMHFSTSNIFWKMKKWPALRSNEPSR